MAESQGMTYAIWIFQLATWALIITFTGIQINLPGLTQTYEGVIMGFMIAFYVIYVLLCLCHNDLSYISSIKEGTSITDLMRKVFFTAPTKSVSVRCYHTRQEYYYSTTTVNGHRRSTRRRRTVEVTTFNETFPFNYYSWKDISDAFKLRTEDFRIDVNSAFIKLELSPVIELSRDGTENDYVAFKNNLFSAHRNRDVYIQLTESQLIPGLETHSLVNVGKSIPWFFGSGWYILFTFLTCWGFYNWYFNKFCVHQEFSVRKLISTRVNLNEELRQDLTAGILRTPSVLIGTTEIRFDNVNEVNSQFVPMNVVYDGDMNDEFQAYNQSVAIPVAGDVDSDDDQPIAGRNQAQFAGNQAQFAGNQAQFGGNQAQFGGNQAQFGGNQAQFAGNQAQFAGNQGQTTVPNSNLKDQTQGNGNQFVGFTVDGSKNGNQV